jgi:putative membrane protein
MNITSLLLQITPFGQFRGTSLGAALGNMAIFAAFAIILLFIAVKVFDKSLTKVDLEAEIARGNVAAGIVTGAVVIGISIIVAVAMM